MRLEVGRVNGKLTVYHFFNFAKQDSIEGVWTAFELGQQLNKSKKIHFSGWTPKHDKIKTETIETEGKLAYEIAKAIIRKGNEKTRR